MPLQRRMPKRGFINPFRVDYKVFNLGQLDFLIEKLHDIKLMTMIFAAIAASATAFTLVSPLLSGDNLNKRMKAVASERERIRLRERERLMGANNKAGRPSPRSFSAPPAAPEYAAGPRRPTSRSTSTPTSGSATRRPADPPVAPAPGAPRRVRLR